MTPQLLGIPCPTIGLIWIMLLATYSSVLGDRLTDLKSRIAALEAA